jgi:hypothetical protein
MAIIAGTATTHAGAPGLQGLREDLAEWISNLSPTSIVIASDKER